MFVHRHPYRPFLFPEATKLIVGTLPPPRFSKGDLAEGDVDFCYGSKNGMLWPILDKIFGLGLDYGTTAKAVQQRIGFLMERKIGICDIVESAEREKLDASDLGMHNVQMRNIIRYLQEYKNVDTLLFTGGNSKNGPEFFFRKHIKPYNIKLEPISLKVPRIYSFSIPCGSRIIKTVSLTAPSGAANRAIGSLQSFKNLKLNAPDYSTFDFRVDQYRLFF